MALDINDWRFFSLDDASIPRGLADPLRHQEIAALFVFTGAPGLARDLRGER